MVDNACNRLDIDLKRRGLAGAQKADTRECPSPRPLAVFIIPFHNSPWLFNSHPMYNHRFSKGQPISFLPASWYSPQDNLRNSSKVHLLEIASAFHLFFGLPSILLVQLTYFHIALYLKFEFFLGQNTITKMKCH